MSQVGLVIKSYGRQFIVEVDGKNYQAVTKAKKTEYVVGDRVAIDLINQEQLQITSLIERDNLVYRSDQNKSKIIASNVDQILIVTAVKPNCNINFLNNCLIFAESAEIKPIIVLNKTDLLESAELELRLDELYNRKLKYPVIKLSAQQDSSVLTPVLANKTSLLLGQSGVGKSTIINQILPDANTRTGAITKSENSGSHTTTNAELYHINQTTNIIDCPGLQEFGLYHLELDNLIQYFPELRPHAGECRFRNCRHLNEPGCVITKLYGDGQLDGLRFNLLQSISQNLQAKKNY